MFCDCGGVLSLRSELHDYLPVEYLICIKCRKVSYDPDKIKEYKKSVLFESSSSVKFKITFKPAVRVVECDSKSSVLKAANLNGINISSPCGGIGSCEKCKVRVDKGVFLNKEKVFDGGFVLACQIYPESDLEVYVPEASRGEKEHQVLMDKSSGRGVLKGDVGFAVDVGTTTVVAYLVDLSDGFIEDTEGDYNRQMIHGGDIISRMDYSGKNRIEMQNLIVGTINSLVGRLIERNSLKEDRIKKFVFSGNIVMIYLLLGKDAEEIRKNTLSDNFKKAYSGKVKDLGVTGNEAEYFCVPGIGAYVGGDIVSDIIFSGMTLADEISMLIDVGTNGQIAIGNKEFILACSTSAGPALEGGGIECGMRASTGAIDEVNISDSLNLDYRVIGNVKPKGICGSGLISLVSEMFEKKILDYRGKLNRSLKTERITENKFIVAFKEETAGRTEIIITENDIENFIYAKAAIYTGSYVLTQMSGIPFEDMNKIYVAGGFGNFIDFGKAKEIGLFPEIEKEKFVFIGNGSARGAHLILTNKDKKKEVERISKISTYFDLASNKLFMEEYVKAVYLPHMELDRFNEK